MWVCNICGFSGFEVGSEYLHAILYISRKILKYIFLFDFYVEEGGIASHRGLKFGKNTAKNFVYLRPSLQWLPF